MARTKLEVQAFKGSGSGERPAAGAVGPARGRLTFYYDADTDKVYVARLASGVLSYDAITGGFSDPTTTRGDLMVRGASGVARLALGNAGQLLVSNGTDAVWGGIVEAGGAAAPLYSNANARPAAAASYAGAVHVATDTGAVSVCARTGASAYAWKTVGDALVTAPTIAMANNDDGHGRWYYEATVTRDGVPVQGALVAIRWAASADVALSVAAGYGGTQRAELPASGSAAASGTWWGTTDADGHFGVALTPPSSVTVAAVAECQGGVSARTSHAFA